MIQFGISDLKGITNGIGSGCAITTGGAGSTAVVASGYVYIDGVNTVVSAVDVDISAASPTSGTKYLYAYYGAGQSSTATLEVTSANPISEGGGRALIGIFTQASGSITNLDISGLSAVQSFGRAMTCSLNVTYDQAVARGGTLIFPNAAELYNGNIEGTLEHAEIDIEAWRKIYGGNWTSGGVGCGTWTLTGTNQPQPFMIEAQQITKGITSTVQLLKCYSPGLTLNIDRENWTQPSLNFVAVANSGGVVMKVLST